MNSRFSDQSEFTKFSDHVIMTVIAIFYCNFDICRSSLVAREGPCSIVDVQPGKYNTGIVFKFDKEDVIPKIIKK